MHAIATINQLSKAFKGNTPAPHPAENSSDTGPAEKPDILKLMGAKIKDGRQ